MAEMTCPHCNGFWTIQVGRTLVWCSCDDAIQKRREDPNWLYFAAGLVGKAA